MTQPRPRVDVVEIMRGIREDNRRRREQGLWSDEEVEQAARQRFRDWADKAYIDPRLLERFLDPGHDWNIATDYVIRTHRTGLVARLSLIAKRLARPLVRLYTDHVLDRQTQINQYLFHLVTNAIRENVRLAARLEAAERRLAERAASSEPGASTGAPATRNPDPTGGATAAPGPGTDPGPGGARGGS